jgi:thioesterase domain-containing protein/acyl carrier protein
VDRRALPAPESGRLEAEAEYVAPRTPVEEVLSRIWSEVLGRERVGVEDNFFELGGHSLLAMRLVAAIEQEVGVRLPMSLMFEEVTVSRLAVALQREQEAPAEWPTLIPIRRQGTRPPLFIAPGVSGDVFEHHNLVKYLDPAQPVYGLHAVGLDGRRHPHTTIEEMAAHHVSEILEMQPDGPYLLAGYCFGAEVAYEMAHQLHRQGRHVALLALIDAEPPTVGMARLSVLARERSKLEDFLSAGVRGKAAYVRRRARNAQVKVSERMWYAALDQCVRRGWPLPRWLQDVEKVNYRAIKRYVPPITPCRVTLFRAASQAQDDRSWQSSAWWRLAAGGVDLCPVVGEGIDHLSMLKEPHVRELATALTAAIEMACAEVGALAGSR